MEQVPVCPGKLKHSICPAEVSLDATPPLTDDNRFQTSCFLNCSARTPCTSPDKRHEEHHTVLEGNTLSICTAEAFRDTAPCLNKTQCFQYLRTEETGLCNFYYQNVRGLRSKIEDFNMAVADADFEVIVLTETWLNDEIHSAQLFGDKYTVYRQDRSLLRTGKSRGGGVLIAVINSLASSRNPVQLDDEIEQLWVTIETIERKVHVGVVYMSPELAGDPSVMARFVESAERVVCSLGISDQQLLFGDFNQPTLDWCKSSGNFLYPNPHSSVFTSSCITLIDGLSVLGLKQVNSITNNNGRILDLLFVNEDLEFFCELFEPLEPLARVDLHHPPFVTALRCLPFIRFEECDDVIEFDFKRADFDALNAAFLSTDWRLVYEATNINEATNSFINILINIFRIHIPAPRPRQKPPWTNRTLRKLKRERAAALRKYSFSRNFITKMKFKTASARYKSYNRVCYTRYIQRIQTNLKHNPKQFWSFIKEKRNEKGLPSTMFLGDQVADCHSGICDLFANQFGSVFSDNYVEDHQTEAALKDIPVNTLDFRIGNFTAIDIKNAIQNIKCSSAAGPDSIPTLILKRCSDSLCEPLRFLCNESLNQCVFPERWKESTMFPVYKKGDKRNVANYRGITSLSAGSKLLEKLVTRQLFDAVKSYISVRQHGFFPGRSIATNLVEFVSRCINDIQDSYQVDTVYTDLKSAFDRVNHKLLLAKLTRLGAPNNFVKWIESYLVNRRICVKVGSSKSRTFTNLSGVPQGSNLGPLLFSIFVNDICFDIPADCGLLYADDLKIFKTVNCSDDCNDLQALLDRFGCWCTTNCMEVSVKKCAVISFSRKKQPIHRQYSIFGEVIERVSVFKDLGVLLDEQLSFRDHYAHILDKANRNLGFMFRIAKDFRDPYCLRSLYFCLVRSILETATVVWSPYHQIWINRVETVQRKFVRRALRFLPWNNPYELPSYESRCQLLGMKTLQARRDISKAVLIANLLLGNLDAPRILAQLNMNAVPRNLRFRPFFRLDMQRTEYAQNEPIRSMCAVFNHVFDLFDFNVSASVFKERLYSHM